MANPNRFTSISYFTNDFNTRTRGVDMVLGYNRQIGGGRASATLAYNYNRTQVRSGTSAAIANETQRRIFEERLPRHNATGTLGYDIGSVGVMLRGRYYGPWTDVTGNATGELFQRFGGIALFDASLTYHHAQHLGPGRGGEHLRHLSRRGDQPGQSRPDLFAQRPLRHRWRALLCAGWGQLLMIDRRMVLAAGWRPPFPLPGIAASARMHAPAPDDEAFWAGVAAEYDRPSDGIVQLENGNWGAMAGPVRLAYEQAVARVNRDTSYYARRGMLADLHAAREAVAGELGVPPDEIAFTRNATEALKALILGYNRLSPGDAVLYADLDYDSMQACMESLEPRRGVRVRRIALPEPATRQALIDAYAEAMAAEPRLKLILLTHLSHRTGLVLPVREIARWRGRGVSMSSWTRRIAGSSWTSRCPISTATLSG